MPFRLDQRAVRRLESSAEVRAALEDAAKGVEQRARQNARAISPRLANAITASPVQTGPDGAYVDVGYDKDKPGWVLWWHEFGTAKYPATPHLRPALSPSP